MATIDHLLLMAILGHFIGDYLLQNKWMALGKGQNTLEGYAICFLHTCIYTGVVCAFTGQFGWVFWLMVFLSHYPIDKWSLGQVWLDLIKGRNFKFDSDVYLRLHAGEKDDDWKHRNNMVIITSFGCLVYAIVDNTIHIVLMYLGLLALVHFGLV